MNEIQRRKKESNYLLWISKIISEDVKNSNLKNVSVMDAKLSNDGSNLKIYVLFEKNEKKSLEILNSIKGFIRSELSKYDSNSKKIPNIFFQIDDVFKTSNKIEQILKEIKEKEGKNKKENE